MPTRRPPLRRRLGFDQTARMLATVIAEAARTPSGRPMRVLEAGVGSGAMLEYLLDLDLATGIEFYGFDIADTSAAVERLSASRPSEPWGERILSTSSDHWPFDDAFFDVVISNQVLEHVADIPVFLRECRRVLGDGGTAIHVFPTLRMAIEPHLFVPYVHRLRSDRTRFHLLSILYRCGFRKDGLTSPRDAARDVQYLRHSTHYCVWREIMEAAATEGFVGAPRRSMGYLTGLAIRAAARPASLGPRRTTIRDRCSVLVAERLFSVTLLLWAIPMTDPEARSD